MITLLPHQLRASAELDAILRAHRIAYLVGEMRTGKTLTAMHLVKSIGFKRALLVTKKKAIASIEKDRDALGLTDVVTVTNFEQLPKFAKQSFGLLIVDEAHGVGAYPKPSKRFKDLQQIARNAVLLMSGTPSPESFSQLYHQMKLGASPWAGYKNFYAWANDYVVIKQKYVGAGQKVNDYSGAIESKVLADVRPLTVTMTQAEAGFTTVIEERVHMVKMKPRTYRLAERILKDGVIGSPRGRAVVADTGAKAMSKLQQIYGGAVISTRMENGFDEDGNPIKVPVDHVVKFDDSKAQFVRDEFGHTRHAILYKFTAEGDMLKRLYGNAWTDSPELFNENPDALAYIGQVQSSREGVNLSAADHLVFVGIDFAALSYLQGINRAAHMHRTRPNIVHWVFAHGGMEPRVYQTVRGKVDYTKKHFEHDRATMAIEADQAIRGGRMDGDTPIADEPGRVSRLAFAQA